MMGLEMSQLKVDITPQKVECVVEQVVILGRGATMQNKGFCEIWSKMGAFAIWPREWFDPPCYDDDWMFLVEWERGVYHMWAYFAVRRLSRRRLEVHCALLEGPMGE